MEAARILVLDGETATALAIVQSLGAAGHHCLLAGTDNRAPAFASRWVRGTALYPDPLNDAAAFQAWITGCLKRHQPDLVIPVTESTLVPLHRLRDHPLVAHHVAMPCAHALDTALDKQRLHALAASLGVPVPPSTLVSTLAEVDDGRIAHWLAEGVAVVKTVRSKVWQGAGARQFPTALVSDARALWQALRERLHCGAVQVQSWVPGCGVGVMVLACGGEVLMSIAHERLHELPLTGGGSSYRRTIAMPAPLLRHAQALMRELDYTGVAMVEFRVDGGRHWLMEVNPRFWGSLPLSVFAGADFPRALVALLLHGRRPDAAPPRIGVTARAVTRDLQWTKLVLRRRGRFGPHELGRPPGRSLLEWARVLGGREVWDGASLRDPRPLLRELRHLAASELAAAHGKARRRMVQQAARLTSPARARKLAPAGRLLILCHGNICRSAYAAVRLQALQPAVRTLRSAGFHPQPGRCTPEHVQRAARCRGVELAAHRSRCVSADDLAWADLVVLMDQRNHDALRTLDPHCLRKVVWLGALDGGPVEIDDPYDADEAGVQAVLTRLDACVQRLAQLAQLALRRQPPAATD